jgi:phage-related protein
LARTVKGQTKSISSAQIEMTKQLSAVIEKLSSNFDRFNDVVGKQVGMQKELADAAKDTEGALGSQAKSEEVNRDALHKLAEREQKDNKELMNSVERIMNIRERMRKTSEKFGLSEETLNRALNDQIDYIKSLGEVSGDLIPVHKQWWHSVKGLIKSYHLLWKNLTLTQKVMLVGKAQIKLYTAALKGLWFVAKGVFKVFEIGVSVVLAGFTTALDILGDALKTVGVGFESVGKVIYSSFAEPMKAMYDVLKHAVIGLYGSIKNFMGQMIDIFLGQFPIIPDILKEFGNLTETIFKEVFMAIEDVFSHMHSFVSDVLSNLLSVITSPFESLQNILKSIADTVGNLLATAFKSAANIIKASMETVLNIINLILSSTVKLMVFFWNTATEMYSGVSQWRQELEKLRAEYGNLERGVARFAINMAKASKSAFRQFRYFRGEVLALAAELVKNLGPTVEAIMGQLADPNSQKLLMLFNKGLTLSAEAMQEIARESLASGKPMLGILRDIHDSAQALAKAFNVSAKLIAKDIGEMKVDIASWGGLTTKQMAAAAMRTRSLGLEIKKVAGIVKAFDTFKDASKNVAMLSRAFGVQIDSLRMMKEEDPTKRIETIRKEFSRLGRSTETMSRRQIMLLAQTTGLDEATAKAAFSTRNQGKSIEEINKQLDKSQAKKKTDKQRVSELKEEIERLVKSGHQFTGIWDAMTKGFERGTKVWARQTGLTADLTVGLRKVYKITKLATKEFLEHSDAAEGFAAQTSRFFEIFTEKGEELQKTLENLFKDIEKNAPNAFGTFWDKIISIFKAGGLDIEAALVGLKKVFLTLFGQISGAVIRIIGNMIVTIVELINDPARVSKFAPGMEWTKPIVAAFSDVWKDLEKPLKTLWESLSDWFWRMWGKLKKIAIDNWELMFAAGMKIWHENISPFVDGILDGLQSKYDKIKNGIHDLLKNMKKWIVDWWKDNGDKVIAGMLVGTVGPGLLSAAIGGIGKTGGAGALGKLAGAGVGALGAYSGRAAFGAGSTGAAVSGIGGGALSGAMVGSMFGPMGIAVGGAVGALTGFIYSLETGEEKLRKGIKGIVSSLKVYFDEQNKVINANIDKMKLLNSELGQATKSYNLEKAHTDYMVASIKKAGDDLSGLSDAVKLQLLKKVKELSGNTNDGSLGKLMAALKGDEEALKDKTVVEQASRVASAMLVAAKRLETEIIAKKMEVDRAALKVEVGLKNRAKLEQDIVELSIKRKKDTENFLDDMQYLHARFRGEIKNLPEAVQTLVKKVPELELSGYLKKRIAVGDRNAPQYKNILEAQKKINDRGVQAGKIINALAEKERQYKTSGKDMEDIQEKQLKSMSELVKLYDPKTRKEYEKQAFTDAQKEVAQKETNQALTKMSQNAVAESGIFAHDPGLEQLFGKVIDSDEFLKIKLPEYAEVHVADDSINKISAGSSTSINVAKVSPEVNVSLYIGNEKFNDFIEKVAKEVTSPRASGRSN